MDQGIFTKVQEEEEAGMGEAVWTREALIVGTANWYAKFTITPLLYRMLISITFFIHYPTKR